MGEYAIDSSTEATVQILEKMEVWGYVSYRVYNPSTGKVYKITEEQLKKVGSDENYNADYLRYVVLLSKIKNETSGGLLSSLSNGVIPLPHQLHVLQRAMTNNNIRYILADEVGLGKTIEAGMIIKELKTRGLVKRVLVVCPTGLVTQWAAEMQEKFNEKFNIILPSDYDTIRRLTDSNDVYSQYDQVISPMDGIKPIEKHIGWDQERVDKYNDERINAVINSGWDLIIIDEAHRVAGSSSEVARYKLGNMLAQSSQYLLLLSATPHNGKTEPFLRLVRLLDKSAFPNAQSIVKEQVAPFLIRTEKREAIDNNGNKLFKQRITHLVSMNWDDRHSMQRELYSLVTEYVSKTYNKAIKNRKKNMCLIFLLVIMQRMVASSTAAIRQSLERRLLILQSKSTKLGSLTEEDLLDLNIEDNVEEALEAISLNLKDEEKELEHIIYVAKQAELQYSDVKVEELLNITDRIIGLENQKIIIFTEFVATQKYLQRILVEKGYEVVILNGGMSIEDRNIAIHKFRNEANVFISTDAGGEGLNLQFASVIVNYDLPWNPMKIEQRCGRVDRIGQKQDVNIYNFIVEDTVENRVRAVLEEKLSVILEEMGVDKYSDVLDSEVAEYNFTDVYMDSLSKKRNQDINVYKIESDIKEQINNANKYRDIIKEEKDLTELIGQGPNIDIEYSLRQMLTYYDLWRGIPPILIDVISITDPEIVHHLNSDIIQDKSGEILSVTIPGASNEAGYFMLWELSISEDNSNRVVIPIFVNENFVLRPIAGKRLMEIILETSNKLITRMMPGLSHEEYDKLEKICMDFSYDSFVDLRDKQTNKNLEQYNKYMYALKLRTEAVSRIGIENIRKSRLAKLDKERMDIEQAYKKGQQVYPDFKLNLLVKLEA